jgi:hypothetical protein
MIEEKNINITLASGPSESFTIKTWGLPRLLCLSRKCLHHSREQPELVFHDKDKWAVQSTGEQ